jgi:uncharacterized delta-60 repeat protein
MVDQGDLEAAVLQSDGKLIALGTTGNNFTLLRFNLDGSLDPTFGSGGTGTTTFGGGNAEGSDLVFQADGKLLAGGLTSSDFYFNNSDFALARYEVGGMQLTSAVSRKTHGNAGTFDINLPLTGTPGVECRNSGGNHALVFTFSSNPVSGDVSIMSGTAAISGTPTYNNNTMTVNLSGVADEQMLTLMLSNVTDSSSRVMANTTVSVNMLVGDTNANGVVNASDVSQTKARFGQTLNATNFRSDVNASGTINASDGSMVKAKAGNASP